MAAGSTGQVRPARPDDHAEIQRLMRQAHWPVRSRAGWDWAFQDNPARHALAETLGEEPAIGWVIETDHGLAGYLGNIPQRYWHAGRWLSTATCTSYYVREDQRALSVNLMRAYFLQPGIVAAYTTTANEHSAGVYRLYKAREMADPGYGLTQFWVADDRVLLGSLLTRRGLPGARLLAGLTAPLCALGRRLTGAGCVPRQRFEGEVRQETPTDIGPDHQRFWELLAARPGIWLDRRPDSLRWRLADPDNREHLFQFAARDRQGLAGYALGIRYTRKAGLLPRAYLLDLELRPDAPPDTAAALLRAVIRHAARLGLAEVEAQGFSAAHPLLTLPLGGYRRPVSRGGGHYLRYLDRGLARALGDDAPWRMTGVDGDFWYGLTGFE